ncbi:hypothetical protein EBZ39_12645 [bacterium]|nr:hypothetical protein [bacterium]
MKAGSKKQSLTMAQRDKEKLAPVLFTGRCDELVVEDWLEHHLVPELKNPSVIVADNAPFHRKNKRRAIPSRWRPNSWPIAFIMSGSRTAKASLKNLFIVKSFSLKILNILEYP